MKFCQGKGIQVTGYTPLGGSFRDEGGLNILTDPTVVELSKRYSKTPAQVILKWNISRSVVVIPKSGNAARIAENINVFDFEFSEQDLTAMNRLEKGHRFLNPYDWYGGALFM